MEKAMQYAVVCTLMVGLSFVSACSMCDYKTGSKTESTSHEYVATTEGADCGAVSGYETFVEIQRPYYIHGAKVWTSKQTLLRGTVGVMPDCLEMERRPPSFSKLSL
jgi:hypothetical protein